MALIHRLFQHSREKRRSTWGCGAHKKDQNFESPEMLTSYKCWQAPLFAENQIRLLVFKECDVKGKKILIDSKAIHKVEPTSAENVSGRTVRTNHHNIDSKCPSKPNSPTSVVDGYKFSRPGSDIKMLGEMLFGSIAMSYRGPMIKVHTFKMPPKLMLSRMFLLKPPKEHLDSDGSDKDTISLYCADMTIPRSISSNNLPAVEIAHSLPIAMPASPPNRGLDDESGEFSASGSFLNPFLSASPGSSVSSTASNNSLHRRWLRNQVTSMENVARRRSSENINTADEPIRPRKRYPKIGVAILFSLPEEPSGKEDQEFSRFFFSHFTLFESHFQQLVSSIEKALITQRKNTIRPIMEALSTFKSTIIMMYTAPRIQRPVWLNMMTYPQQRGHLCEHLIKELATLLELHNNKQNNFFMSRLLTGVLMHHLAWVPTVMPAGSTPSRAFLDKHSSTTLDMLAKSHPYNPLWAQLGDMYGTIGLPNRVAKTVVVGKRADIVCRFLYVLSYFIRCSEVHEVHEKCEDIIMDYVTKCGLLESDELERQRSLTEDSVVMAKTEDSGIEDVGSTHTDIVKKPLVYIQTQTGSKVKLPETLSDDGVSLDSELHYGDISKQPGCILDAKRNGMNLKSSQLYESEFKPVKGFEGSDEVFNSKTDAIVCKVVDDGKIDIQKESYVNTEDTQTKVQLLNDKNENICDQPVIVCKMSDSGILQSKIEVATSVGRASRNIDDLLKFDSGEPNGPQQQGKDNIEKRPCRTLTDIQLTNSITVTNTMQDRQSTPKSPLSGNSSPITISTEKDTDYSHTSMHHDGHLHRRRHKSKTDSCSSNGNLDRTDQYSKRAELYIRSISSMSGVSTASSTLSHMSDHTCADHEELPLACSEQMFEIEVEKSKSHVDNFGRSLLGGYSQHYVPDLALQGVSHLDLGKVEDSLRHAAQHPVLDESISEAVCIVADTDHWTVDAMSCEGFQGCGEKPNKQDVISSCLVDRLLESVKLLCRMKLPSDFCLMHLEDRLQEMFFQSSSVASYLELKPTIGASALAGAINVDCSDLPLLLAVASVHSPHVIANVMRETIEQQRMSSQQESP